MGRESNIAAPANVRRGIARFSAALAAALALAPFALVSISSRIASAESSSGATTREEKSREAIDSLVKDLGSDDFEVRESATESLVALGDAARPALEKARSSDDPEVRSRATRCLREIGGENEAESDTKEPARKKGSRDLGFRLTRRGPSGGPPPVDPNELIEEMERRLFEAAPNSDATSSVSIRIQENDRSWTYSEDSEKGVEARVVEPGRGERVITAPNREAFMKENPELAKKLGVEESSDAADRRGVARRFALRDWPSAPLFPSRLSCARLGVAVESVDEKLAKRLSLDPPRGVVVLEVEGHSPADALGLEPDDVLLTLNGSAIDTAASLRRAVRDLEAGDPVRIEIVRKGELRVVESRF